jgi:hypothetical protein
MKDVVDDVLRLTGYTLLDSEGRPVVDNEVEPTRAADGKGHWWSLRSSSSKHRDGLYRVVHFAWYHQTYKYRGQTEALCAKPISGARGEWALTELGVKRAKQLCAEYDGKIVFSAEPNKTARFLATHFDQYYKRIIQHLRRKMPRSEEFDKIDDHAMGWIERIIQRDGLRSRIEEGKSIPPSQVQLWACRGAYTDVRNEGREPVCRVLHGALTKREIGLYDPSNWTETVIPRTLNESENLSGVAYAEHSEDDHVGDPIDNLRDDHALADVEGTVMSEDALSDVLDRVAAIIRDEIDPDLDPAFHQLLMVERFVKEMTLHEIAEAHGLDVGEVVVPLNRVRDAMLRARDDGDFDDVIVR